MFSGILKTDKKLGFALLCQIVILRAVLELDLQLLIPQMATVGDNAPGTST